MGRCNREWNVVGMCKWRGYRKIELSKYEGLKWLTPYAYKIILCTRILDKWRQRT